MTLERKKQILEHLEKKHNIHYLTDVGCGYDSDGDTIHQYVGMIDGDGVLIQLEQEGSYGSNKVYVSVGNAKRDYVERYYSDKDFECMG